MLQVSKYEMDCDVQQGGDPLIAQKRVGKIPIWEEIMLHVDLLPTLYQSKIGKEPIFDW